MRVTYISLYIAMAVWGIVGCDKPLRNDYLREHGDSGGRMMVYLLNTKEDETSFRSKWGTPLIIKLSSSDGDVRFRDLRARTTTRTALVDTLDYNAEKTDRLDITVVLRIADPQKTSVSHLSQAVREIEEAVKLTKTRKTVNLLIRV